MTESLIFFLQTHVLPLGAFGVFLASVVEEVLAPIPSALIMTMSGFLLLSGPVSLGSISALVFKVAIPAALGVTIGSYFVFYIARFGGKPIIESWGKYVGLYWSDVESLRGKMLGTKKDEILIAAARIIPIFPSVVISAFCGILQMNPIKYFVISFAGIFVRGLILGTIGWQVAGIYEKYAKVISSIENVVLLSTVLGVVLFVVLKYKSKTKQGANVP